MMHSRGGVTGGLTISEVLSEYEARGFTSQFAARPGGMVECVQCGHHVVPDDVVLRSMRRIEGVSDPADMALVGALECPNCHAQGTATIAFGPHAPREDAELLRRIEDIRPSAFQNARFHDESLVRDTGWIDRGDRADRDDRDL